MTVPHLGTVSVQAKSFPDKRVSKKKEKKKEFHSYHFSRLTVLQKGKRNKKKRKKSYRSAPRDRINKTLKHLQGYTYISQ